MPVLKRELAFSAARPVDNTGDWWHLVLDTDAPGLYVEHRWVHTNSYGDNQIARGEERFGINDFLSLAEGRQAHTTLLAALKEMFRQPEMKSEEGGPRDDQTSPPTA
jgi:hypothetical protein